MRQLLFRALSVVAVGATLIDNTQPRLDDTGAIM
jgi:hypothetical protein